MHFSINYHSQRAIGPTRHTPSITTSSLPPLNKSGTNRCLRLDLKLKLKQKQNKKRKKEERVVSNMIIAFFKYKHKKKNGGDHSQRNRFLITINVHGSAGPMRFIVNQDDLVGSVIHTALKSYAKEGRLPVLGTQASDFFLYRANAGFDALSPLTQIGTQGVRNFVLCKKQRQLLQMTDKKPSNLTAQKGTSCWKSWLNDSFTFKLKIPFMR